MNRQFIQTIALLCCGLMATPQIVLADPPRAAESTAAALTPEQLDSLTAPIALYPDQLLSQILVATTYPLEIVQAGQWVQQHPELKGEELTKAVQQQTWDASVQALVAFPDVLKRLNQDITWTTNIGNAFLADQASVMDSVQRLRLKAQEAGKLNTTPQQKVVTTTENGTRTVEIQPADEKIVYVPVYNPALIWGPPAYYYYPGWCYPPPGAVLVDDLFWFGTGIFVGAAFIGWRGWGWWGWHPAWHSRTIVVNNVFIERNHFRHVDVVRVHDHDAWVHNSAHRVGVAYPNRGVADRFHSAPRPHFSPVQVEQRMQESASRFRGPTDRMGSHPIGPGVYNRNHSAFGGIERGTDARMHSQRGASSLSHATPSGGRDQSAAPTNGGDTGSRGDMNGRGGWRGGAGGGGSHRGGGHR